MDIKVNGIVLTTQEYKDKDVLISIFTAELGKITAVLKGVRGAKAKLKYAAQPFCFGEWVLSKKGDRFTVTSCVADDLFFDLTKDYDRYTIGCAMLQMCNYVLKPNIIAQKLLILLLNSLKTLTYSEVDAKLVLLKFMLSFISDIGYGFAWDKCGNCGSVLMGDVKYSIANRTITCPSCAGIGAVNLDKQSYTTMKIVDSTHIDKLNTVGVKQSVLINSLYILKLHIENVVGIKLSSLQSWV